MKITDDEKKVLQVIERVDKRHGKGTTPLLISDFIRALPSNSSYTIRKLLASLTKKGILYQGKWDRSSAWTIKERL